MFILFVTNTNVSYYKFDKYIFCRIFTFSNINNNTKNFIKFLYEHLRWSLYHILLKNVLLGNRHNTHNTQQFCCPDKNADIVLSLGLVELSTSSSTNKAQHFLEKKFFFEMFKHVF